MNIRTAFDTALGQIDGDAQKRVNVEKLTAYSVSALLVRADGSEMDFLATQVVGTGDLSITLNRTTTAVFPGQTTETVTTLIASYLEEILAV